jgi:hypothetical protein
MTHRQSFNVMKAHCHQYNHLNISFNTPLPIHSIQYFSSKITLPKTPRFISSTKSQS